MTVLFTKPPADAGSKKAHYESTVKRVAALAWSVFGSGRQEHGANGLLAIHRKAEGDQVAFAGSTTEAQLVEYAKAAKYGVAADFFGETRLAIALEKHGGEKVAVDFKPAEALALAGWLVSCVKDLDLLDNLTATERRELKHVTDTIGRAILELDGTRERVEEELRKNYERIAETKHFSSLAALERKAEATVAKKYEQVVRDLSMAASMPSGNEKSAMLLKCKDVIAKAFGDV